MGLSIPSAVERFFNSAHGWGLYAVAVFSSVVIAACGAIVHPLAAIGIVLGILFLVGSIRSPFILLVSFVIFMVGRLADFFPILGSLQAGKILSFGALGIFLFSKLQKRDYSIVRSPVNTWFLLFAAAILLSSIASTWPTESFREFREGFLKTIILFFLILNIVKNRSQIVIFQISIVVVCVAIGGYSFISHAVGRDLLTGAALLEGSRSGMVGALGDPNDTAFVILMAVPFLLLTVIEAKSVIKLPFIGLFFLAIAGIVSTQSRGGLLGLIAAVGLIVNRYVKNKILLITVMVVFCAPVVILAGVPERQERMTGKDEAIDASSQGRLDAWSAGMRMLIFNPLTGVGFEQFANNMLEYLVNPYERKARATHNSYIQVASETGLPGIIAFLGIIILTLKSSYRIGRLVERNSSSFFDITRAGLFPNLVGLLIPAFFLSQGYSPILFVEFAFVAVCANVLESEKTAVNETHLEKSR